MLRAHRGADRRRGLPRAERGHPGRRPQGRRGLRPRVRRLPATAGGARSRTSPGRSASPEVRGILPRGGTILGLEPHQPAQGRGRRRADPREPGERPASTRSSRSAARTPSASRPRCPSSGLTVVGVPKTIDNDLGATDYTFGFDTAVTIAIEAIDRLHTTAETHHRVLIVRGDGPPRRLDRAALRPRRRRQRHPHPGAAVRHRRGLPRTSSSRFALEYAPIVVVAEGAVPKEGTMARAGRPSSTRSATSGSAASGTCSSARSRRAPARRRAPRCSATCSAAARRRRTTGCSRPGSGCTRSTRCTTAPAG